MYRTGLHGRRRPSADGWYFHVNNGTKFKLQPSISWADSDAWPRSSFWDGRMNRWTKVRPWRPGTRSVHGMNSKRCVSRAISNMKTYLCAVSSNGFRARCAIRNFLCTLVNQKSLYSYLILNIRKLKFEYSICSFDYVQDRKFTLCIS